MTSARITRFENRLLLICSDGQELWLDWFDSILFRLGLTDAQALQRRRRPGLTKQREGRA